MKNWKRFAAVFTAAALVLGNVVPMQAQAVSAAENEPAMEESAATENEDIPAAAEDEDTWEASENEVALDAAESEEEPADESEDAAVEEEEEDTDAVTVEVSDDEEDSEEAEEDVAEDEELSSVESLSEEDTADLLAEEELEEAVSVESKDDKSDLLAALEEAPNIDVVPMGEVQEIGEVEVNPLYVHELDESDLLAAPSEEEVEQLREENAQEFTIEKNDHVEVMYDEGSESAILKYDDGTAVDVVSDVSDLLEANREIEGVEYLDFENASDYLQEAMKKRETTVAFNCWEEGAVDTTIFKRLVKAAYAHTGVSNEGDYIRWNYGGSDTKGSTAQSTKSGSMTFYKITYAITYYTTAAQEAEADTAIASLRSQLGLSGMSDYNKIRTIYEYICNNVTYDSSSSGTLKHSGYAAIVNHNSVCQGYALFFYRMALEEGIDSRLIAGYGSSQTSAGAHAWNIVKLGSKYYNLDATWDAGESPFHYFLECNSTFTNNGNKHWRWGENDGVGGYEYDSSDFEARYPMSSTDFGDLAGATVTLPQTSYTYTGSEIRPKPSVSREGVTLTEGTDYQVSYSNNVNVGSATVTVTGGGNWFKGTAQKTFTITEAAPTTPATTSITDSNVSLGSTSYTYTGSAITPAVTVTIGGTTYVQGTDYQVSYSNNTNVGTATVSVEGKGALEGTVTKSFTITQVTLNESHVTFGSLNLVYTGAAQVPSVAVRYDGRTLAEGTDYQVSCSGNTNVGTGSITVQGIGNFTGTIQKSITISKADIAGGTLTLSESECSYDGTAKMPGIASLVLNGTTVPGSDYDVSYENNVNAGTGRVVVTAKGSNYTGQASATFVIKPGSIAQADVVLEDSVYDYDGEDKTPQATVWLGNRELVAGTDYEISYQNNRYASTVTEEGFAYAVITGKGNYTGTIKSPFNIRDNEKTWDLSLAEIRLSSAEYIYNGKERKPTVTVWMNDKMLAQNSDYALIYQNNVNAGTATAKISTGSNGKYKNTNSVKFTIKKATQTVDPVITELKLPVGSKTTIAVKKGQGTRTFKSSNTGVATITASGNSATIHAKTVGTTRITAYLNADKKDKNYEPASSSISIEVIPVTPVISTTENKSNGVSLSWKKVDSAGGYYVFRNNKRVKEITGASTTSFVDTGAKGNGTTYSYTLYSYKKLGSKAYTSKVSSTKKVTFISAPAGLAVSNPAASQMKISWRKNAKATGYEVQYATNSKFTKPSKLSLSSKYSKKTVKKLKKGKKYYVRIRSKNSGGHSEWSKTKAVTIKK